MAAINQTPPDRSWSCRLLERRPLTESTFELRLSRPPGFDFIPGQHIALHLEGVERDYSLVSAPSEDELAILVRRIASGRMTPYLDQAPVGTRLRFTGPDGHFVFHAGHRPAVMVATGTGIAPLAAMLRSGVRPSLLLHGVRSDNELYYRHEIQAAVDTYVPCLSGASARPTGVFQGRVTRYLETRLDPLTCDFYLAGRIEMIHDAMQIIDKRFPAVRVFTEAFF